MKLLVVFVVLLGFGSCWVSGAKILGLYPFPGHSHYHLHRALYRALAERGHDVTVVNCFGEKVPPKNGTYKDIILTGICDNITGKRGDKKWNMFTREGLNPFVGAYITATLAHGFIEKTLAHEKVQQLLKSGEKFDVVICDQFLSEAYKAFALHFQAPLVILNPVGPNFWINPLVGNPNPISYIPNVLLEYPPKMTFCERLINTLIYVFNELYYNLCYYPKHDAIVKKYISKDLSLYDIIYNTSVVLLNSHSSTSQPVPKVPNMIEIAGFHVEPPKKLPKDLQDFMDNSPQGVIYFSMGSNLKSIMFPEEKRNALIKAFSKLKQNVLWKWEDDDLPNKPANVKLIQWAPQQDILAHPNLKLFITHGGFVSSVETAYHEVPVLMIPIFGDQFTNANFAKDNGFGRFIKYGNLTEESLVENVNIILNDPSYKQNAIKRSRTFHDRPVSPKETAVYWVEYVIRHKGAPHLRVAALDLPWYKYLLLDVIAVVAIAILVPALISCCIFKKICKRFCKKKEQTKKTVVKKTKKVKKH